MFLQSIFNGLAVLTYWQTYVAGLIYVLIIFIPMIAFGFLLKEEGVGGLGCLFMILNPLIQTFAIMVFTFTMAPIILGVSKDAAWGLPWVVAYYDSWWVLKTIVKLFLLSLALSFVPFVGQLQTAHTMLIGGTVLVIFLRIIGEFFPQLELRHINVTPDILTLVGFLAIGGAAVSACIFGAAYLQTRLGPIGKDTWWEEWLLLIQGAVFGFIPIFIYGAWLGLQAGIVDTTPALPKEERKPLGTQVPSAGIKPPLPSAARESIGAHLFQDEINMMLCEKFYGKLPKESLPDKFKKINLPKILGVYEAKSLWIVHVDPPHREFPNVIIFRHTDTELKRVFEGLTIGITPKLSTVVDLHTIGFGFDIDAPSFVKGEYNRIRFNDECRHFIRRYVMQENMIAIPYTYFIHIHLSNGKNNAYTIDKTMFYDIACKLFGKEWKFYPRKECTMYDLPKVTNVAFEYTNYKYKITAVTDNNQLWIIKFDDIDVDNMYIIGKKIMVKSIE